MKLHKSFLIAATLIAAVSLSGCKQDPADSSNKVELSIKNGSLNIDPATTKYIDLTFPTEMDMNYSIYISYYDARYDIIESRWANSYTYRIYVELLYDTDYKFVINDKKFLDSQNNSDHGYNIKDSFWRDTKGNIIDTISIEFSTISSPRTGNKTYEMNIPFNYTINLADNSKNYDDSQQGFLYLNNFLDHDKVRAGDTVKIPYKIESQQELNNIYVDLIDISGAANGWLDLTEANNILLVDHLEANTEKVGTIEFKITENMLRNCSLQIWTTFTDNPNLVSFKYFSN